MNLSYLMEYISYHHHTIVRAYSLERKLIASHCGRYAFEDIFSNTNRGGNEVLKLLSPGPTKGFEVVLPKLTQLGSSVIYATVFSPEHFFLLGPVRFHGELVLIHTIEQMSFTRDFLDSVPAVDYDFFMNDLLLLHNLFHEDTISMRDIFSHNFPQKQVNDTIQKNYSELVFHNQEYGSKHNPYDQEIREQNSIRTGDVEQLKKSWTEDYVGTLGTLAPDKLRNTKNLGIVIITLASRSAIAGGILPEVSFSLSDSFCMQIEAARSAEAVLNIARDAEMQYTLLVHEIQEQHKKSAVSKKQHPKVEKCKDYIFAHLHEKILVTDIADELLVHPNYLSELFKKTEGISITDFILKEKINLARNLLMYSDYSYIEIATYLGFASQSHLGRLFKIQTGMTPHQYRKEYGRDIL